MRVLNSESTEFSLKNSKEPENRTGQITCSHTLLTLAYQHISRKSLLRPQQTLSGHNQPHKTWRSLSRYVVMALGRLYGQQLWH